MGVRVMPGEKGVVAEAAEAIGARNFGLDGPQFLVDHLEIHDPWDHRSSLWPFDPLASWLVL